MTPVILVVALSILILVHEAGHFLMARWLGIRVERFSIGFGPVLLKWKRDETEYVLSALPLGGYVKMSGEQSAESTGARWEYSSRPVYQRVGIVFAGPFVNYVMGALLFILVFWAGYPVLTPKVGQVIEGFPAQAAGVRPGDEVLAINGTAVDSWEVMTERVRSQTSGAPIALRLRRDGTEQTIAVTPLVKQGHTILGRPTKVAQIGLVPSGEAHLARYPLPVAVARGIDRTWWLTTMTLQAFWQMATGALPVKESLTGPVGIFYITSSAAALGWRYLAQLFAVISVSLAIFNLLPLPVLDGGHLAFLVWEGFWRKPVSLRIQELLTRAGMCLLIGVLLIVTYNDLIKFQLMSKLTGWFR